MVTVANTNRCYPYIDASLHTPALSGTYTGCEMFYRVNNKVFLPVTDVV